MMTNLNITEEQILSFIQGSEVGKNMQSQGIESVIYTLQNAGTTNSGISVGRLQTDLAVKANKPALD